MNGSEARQLPIVDACWNRIGIRGNRSCPELKSVDHCHNCQTFAKAAELLLDRPVEPEYLRERARFLAEPAVAEDKAELAAVVFDVGNETYALESKHIVEVTEARVPRRIPHRSNAVFRGLVNIHGQLELCFSLAGLLGIELQAQPSSLATRVVVTELEKARAVLSVDRVLGVQRFEQSAFREVPATTARRASPFVRAVLVDREQRIGLLDPDSVRAGLEASLR